MSTSNQHPADQYIKSLDQKFEPSFNEGAWAELEQMMDASLQAQGEETLAQASTLKSLTTIWSAKVVWLPILIATAVFWWVKPEANSTDSYSYFPLYHNSTSKQINQEEDPSIEFIENTSELKLGYYQSTAKGRGKLFTDTAELKTGYIASEDPSLDSKDEFESSTPVIQADVLESSFRETESMTQDSVSLLKVIPEIMENPAEQKPSKKKHLFW